MPRSSTSKPHKPPTFKLTKTPVRGDHARRFQHDLNRGFETWKVATHIDEDGEYGRSTRQAARQVLFGLGISANLELPGGITPSMRSLIRHPDRRRGDLVLYGPAPHHHVEMYIGPGGKTIGHGSRHVDAGTVAICVTRAS